MCGAGKSHGQVFIPGLRRESADGVCQRRERSLKKSPNLVISDFFGKNLVASENPTRVGVHHEDWMVAGVQQDGIGSFGAYAMEIEEFLPKLLCGTSEQFCQRAFVLLVQKRNKDFQSFGFLAEIASGANHPLKFCQATPGGSRSH